MARLLPRSLGMLEAHIHALLGLHIARVLIWCKCVAAQAHGIVGLEPAACFTHSHGLFHPPHQYLSVSLPRCCPPLLGFCLCVDPTRFLKVCRFLGRPPCMFPGPYDGPSLLLGPLVDSPKCWIPQIIWACFFIGLSSYVIFKIFNPRVAA